MSLSYSGNIFVNFSKFHNFRKNHTWQLLLASFVSAETGNQLKVRPNAIVANDALLQQCAHCACKMAAMLTHETSELIGSYLSPTPRRMAFQTSAVTALLCYFTFLHQSNMKFRFFYTYNTLISQCTWPKLWTRFYKVVSYRNCIR